MNADQRMNILNASIPFKLEPKPKEEVQRNEAILKKLPKGFGPDHPQWNVPSLRNKWLMTQGVRFAPAQAPIVNPVEDNPYRVKR